MMEILQYIDVVPQQEFESVVIPIKYALAGDIAQVIGSLTAGGSSTTVGRQQTRTGLTSGGGGGFGGGGGAGGIGGQGGFGNQMGNQQYGQQQAGALGAGGLGGANASRSSFADRLRNIVNSATRGGQGGDVVILGTTKIIADERTNSLLIFASKTDLSTISNIIDKLDVVLPQVLIEAIIMEVSLGDELKYGLSYLQRSESRAGDILGIGAIKNGDFLRTEVFKSLGSNAVGALPGGFSYAARFGDKFDVTATAAANDSRINVLSRPRIQTSHAVEANLFVGRTRPYVTGQSYYYGGAGPQTQFQQQQIGITLSVLPLINPDGLVVMDIRQRIQSLGKEIPIDANFSVPETIDREANAKVSVRDRETIILGGFISNERSKSKSGVPILKDIPILGNLFSSNSRKDDRSELIVMIRPTVLPNPQDAAVAAIEEKAKLPGISRAEQEIEIFERQEQKKAAKEIKRLREKSGEN
jgi:general secretion pathway protein D